MKQSAGRHFQETGHVRALCMHMLLQTRKIDNSVHCTELITYKRTYQYRRMLSPDMGHGFLKQTLTMNRPIFPNLHYRAWTTNVQFVGS